jgi:hypothetical protein
MNTSVSEEGSFPMFRMMWAAGFSKILVPIYQTTPHRIPEDSNINVNIMFVSVTVKLWRLAASNYFRPCPLFA